MKCPKRVLNHSIVMVNPRTPNTNTSNPETPNPRTYNPGTLNSNTPNTNILNPRNLILTHLIMQDLILVYLISETPHIVLENVSLKYVTCRHVSNSRNDFPKPI